MNGLILHEKNKFQMIQNKIIQTAENIKAVWIVLCDGKVKISGLDAGTYKLKEIKAPDGYNKLVGDVTIKIAPTYNTSTQKLEKVDVTYTIGDQSKTITITNKDASPEIPIENKSGSVLPDTGGNGTIMFTIVGVGILAVMISCSAISRKRRRA